MIKTIIKNKIYKDEEKILELTSLSTDYIF